MLLAGCAGSPSGQAGTTGARGASSPPTTFPATTAPPTTAPPAPTALPTTPSPTPPARGKGSVLTLTGTVRAGVEHGCLVLSTPQGVYLLLGNGTTDLRSGARVEVRGRTDETRFTTCQQGQPFLVSSARVLS